MSIHFSCAQVGHLFIQLMQICHKKQQQKILSVLMLISNMTKINLAQVLVVMAVTSPWRQKFIQADFTIPGRQIRKTLLPHSFIPREPFQCEHCETS